MQEHRESAVAVATQPNWTRLGICPTCMHAGACVNFTKAVAAIWICDQFDLPPSRRTHATGPAPPPARDLPPARASGL